MSPYSLGYLAEARRDLEHEPDLDQLVTYDVAAERYAARFDALGYKSDAKRLKTLFRNLANKGVIRRYMRAGRVCVLPVDLENYLRHAAKPRPYHMAMEEEE